MKQDASLVLDLGTTGVKAFVFDEKRNVLYKSYRVLRSRHPKTGRVEQDPVELIRASIVVMRDAVKRSGVDPKRVCSFGITTQRETVIAWDADTGRAAHPAIVWQDVRTSSTCRRLAGDHGAFVRAHTGLPIIPYFSATKIAWLLRHVPAVKRLHEAGRLRVGTPDAWLAWNLLEGHPHVTDRTNASRTLLFNIKRLTWDKALCKLFDVPMDVLPRVVPSKGRIGWLKPSVIGVRIPLMALCGDQQASLYAAGRTAGVTKITYGTGTFVMQHVGTRLQMHRPFFTTLAASGSRPAYALEAKVPHGAKEVSPALGHPARLHRVLTMLASKADAYVRQLPTRPQRIVIDGGITQAPELASLQAATSGVRVMRQSIPDGTALGVAKMMKGRM